MRGVSENEKLCLEVQRHGDGMSLLVDGAADVSTRIEVDLLLTLLSRVIAITEDSRSDEACEQEEREDDACLDVVLHLSRSILADAESATEVLVALGSGGGW